LVFVVAMAEVLGTGIEGMVEVLGTGIEEIVGRDLGPNHFGHQRRSEKKSGRGISAEVVLERLVCRFLLELWRLNGCAGFRGRFQDHFQCQFLRRLSSYDCGEMLTSGSNG
jgi:hypothetical protein